MRIPDHSGESGKDTKSMWSCFPSQGGRHTISGEDSSQLRRKGRLDALHAEKLSVCSIDGEKRKVGEPSGHRILGCVLVGTEASL